LGLRGDLIIPVMSHDRFDGVWDATEPSTREAESMKARESLMIALDSYIVGAELTQAAAARVPGVTQPRVSNLVRGKIDLFSLDSLVDNAAAAGLRFCIRVSAPAKARRAPKRAAAPALTRARRAEVSRAARTAWRCASGRIEPFVHHRLGDCIADPSVSDDHLDPRQ
jgi:predicted XRE-type DNA-binding protein